MDLALVIGALGLAVQRAIEFLRDTFDAGNNAPRWLWGALAIGLGTLASYGAEVVVEGLKPNDLGHIITGFVIGGGSNVVHGVIRRVKAGTGR